MKIIVLGGGPGGYEAAIYAAKRGAEVTLIEKDEVGGTCLNRGCIPTKALLASTDVLETVEGASKMGVHFDGEVKADFAEIVARKAKVTANLVKGIHFLMKANKVNEVKGFGKLLDGHTVEVTAADGTVTTETADYIILATGSVPTTPGFFKYDGKRVITSDEVLALTELPKSMVLIGGGVIGCEIGQFLAKMGMSLTVVEMLPQILPTMDEDVSKQLARQFKKDKIKVICGDGIASVEPSEDDVTLTLQSGTVLKAEYALIATGRRPFTAGCGLENAGIELTERGFVKVDDNLKTTCDSVYAIGDILPSVMLAHVATREGFVAVDNIFGAKKSVNYNAVPSAVYTTPEIAMVGQTEAGLKKDGKEYKTGVFEFKGLGKAQAGNHITGFVKVITDTEDTVIGAAIVGHGASDMLQVLTNAVHFGQKAADIGEVIYPHPSMSEAIMEAIHDLHGISVNKA